MKKIIFALLAVAVLANASFASPKWFAGGSLNINSSKYGDLKSNHFGFSPSFGYIIDDKSDVNISLGFYSGKDDVYEYDEFGFTTGNIISEKYSGYSVGVGYERLFLTVSNLYFYLWGGIEYSSTKRGDSEAVCNFNVNITPNVQYGLTENIVLFVNLNFLSLNFDTGDGYNDFSFGVDTGDFLTVGHNSPLTIGVSYLF
jgi:hypothetical protein